MQLYGQTYTRREIEAYTGRLEQLGGLRRFSLVEGREAGVEQIQVRTGAGLSYWVSPARALDISLAEFGGTPLSWQAANGDVHPAYYDDTGAKWLRTAVGGLLMTCGLSYVGAPGAGEGLHGRVHHLAARQVCTEGRWRGDEYEMRIAGVVEETAIFGEHLRLTREIRGRIGHNRIEIEDVVENVGFETRPHMILYHFNFGFPLLGAHTTLRFPSQNIVPREADTPVEGYDRWHTPQVGYQERVYYHQEMREERGRVQVSIHNPHFPLAGDTRSITLNLVWNPRQLPRLVQWHMPGAGVHVLGIEPANCYVEGRAVEHARGTLDRLEPGETRTYQLMLEVQS